jgi:hypothetical protein
LKSAEDLAVQVQRKDGVDDLGGVLFENHVVGEILGLDGIELLALYFEFSVTGGELEDFVALLGDFRGREGD